MGQCVVSNTDLNKGNLPTPPPGKRSFDGSLSQLDVPITAYYWQVYSNTGTYFAGGVTTSGPMMTYDFANNDPNFEALKSYTFCLRLGYYFQTYAIWLWKVKQISFRTINAIEIYFWDRIVLGKLWLRIY